MAAHWRDVLNRRWWIIEIPAILVLLPSRLGNRAAPALEPRRLTLRPRLCGLITSNTKSLSQIGRGCECRPTRIRAHWFGARRDRTFTG